MRIIVGDHRINRPQGVLRDFRRLDEFAAWLEQFDGWYCLSTTTDGYRAGRGFVCSWGCAVDVDFRDKHERKPTEGEWLALRACVEGRMLPGQVWHRTGSGLRVVCLWARPVFDRAEHRVAAEHANAAWARVVRPPFEVDEGCATDALRANWGAAAEGRSAPVRLFGGLRIDPATCRPLGASAPTRRARAGSAVAGACAAAGGAGLVPETPRRANAVSGLRLAELAAPPGPPSRTFVEAAARFNAANLELMHRWGRQCPGCGSPGGFNILPDGQRWACWSDRHWRECSMGREPSLDSPVVATGDPLDIAAELTGRYTGEVLAQLGLLWSRRHEVGDA